MNDQPAKRVYVQIGFFAACLAAAALIHVLTGFTPAARISSATVLRGALAGVLLSLLSIALHTALRIWGGDIPLERAAWEERTARAISRACGEEVLCRGLILAPLLLSNSWAAFAVNFAVSFGIAAAGLRGNPDLLVRSGIKGIEATFLGFLYWWNVSLAVVCAARLVRELLVPAVLERPEIREAEKNLAMLLKRRWNRA